MTDEEIIKRLAEIEGWKKVDQGYEHSYGVLADPLNDWGQLGPLIEKYVNPPHRWSIELYTQSTVSGVQPACEVSRDANRADIIIMDPTSIFRAACLAIIEAHK